MPTADRSSLDSVFSDNSLGYLNWFCEFTAPDSGIGGYFRYGVMPDEGIASVIVQLAGPQRPMISLVDLAAPIQGAPTVARTRRFTFEHGSPCPGESYRITVDGSGDAYDDPTGLLHGATPRNVDVSLDLTWSTGGVSYAYPMSPGYEIPCWTSGSVTVDGETWGIRHAPGQRNHTIGKRDWWAMEWVWTELRLADKSHIIATDVRIPEIGQVSMGCIQDFSGQLVDLSSVLAEVAPTESDVPGSTRICLEPGSLVVPISEADIGGRVGLPLRSDDGREAHFVRAWITPTLLDGRTASGWIEWHRHVDR